MSSSIEAKFTKGDIEMLEEAVQYWESAGMQEYHLMQMVESSPMPPEDHPAYENAQQIKRYFADRRREIESDREIRKERAVFARAKLLLVRQKLAADQFGESIFDMRENSTIDETQDTLSQVAPESSQPSVASGDQLAEFYIHDLGVWKRYQEWLTQIDRGEFLKSEQFKDFIQKK